MFRFILPTLLSSLFPILMSAQFSAYTEFGFIGGFTNYSGDIAEQNIQVGETKIGLGAFGRYTFSNNFAVKGQIYYGEITGDDVNAVTPVLQERKFSFVTPLIETSAIAEFSFLSNERFNSGKLHGSPYFFAGFGLTYAKPDANYYGPDASDPTKNPFPEPQGQNLFFAIPVGLGGKLYLDERIGFSGEFGWRPVFSDKLDGINLSGNPNKKDWYIVISLGLSYIITK